jgi:hypothetical protein
MSRKTIPGQRPFGSVKAIVLQAVAEGLTMDETVARFNIPKTNIWYCLYRLKLKLPGMRTNKPHGSLKRAIIECHEKGLTYADAQAMTGAKRSSLYCTAKSLGIYLTYSKHKK